MIIKEKLNEVKLEIKYKDVIESIERKLSFNSINENLITDIYDLRKKYDIDDSIFNQLIAVVIKPIIQRKIANIANRIDPGNKRLVTLLSRIFLLANISPMKKIQLLDYAEKNNLIPLKDMTFNNVQDLFKKDLLSIPGANIIIDELFESTIKLKGQGATGVSRGELVLAFFGYGTLNAGKKNGDVFLLDENDNIRKILEIKTNNAVIANILNKITNVDFTKLPETLVKDGIRLDLLLGIAQNINGKIVTKNVKINDFKKLMGQDVNVVKKTLNNLALTIQNKKQSEVLNILIKQLMYVLWYENAVQSTKNEILDAINEFNGDNLDDIINLILKKIKNKLFLDYKNTEGFDYLIYFGSKVSAIIDKTIPNGIKLYNIGFYNNGGRPVQLAIKQS